MNPSTRAQASFAAFNHTLAIFVLLYVIDATSVLISSLLLSKISGYSTGTMRVGLFRKMQRMKVRYFDSHSDGDILSRFTSDLDNIFNAMNQALIEIFLSGAQFIGIIWMMFTQNATLAWITMASTPVAIGLSAFVMHQASVSVDRQQDDIGRLNGYINERITGQKMLITNGLQQEKFLRQFFAIPMAGIVQKTIRLASKNITFIEISITTPLKVTSHIFYKLI